MQVVCISSVPEKWRCPLVRWGSMESGVHFDEQLHTQPKHHSKPMPPTISLSWHNVCKTSKIFEIKPTHVILIHSQFQSLTTSQRIGRIRLKSKISGWPVAIGEYKIFTLPQDSRQENGPAMRASCRQATEISSLQQAARQTNTPLTTTGDTGVPSGHGKLRGGGVNVSRDALLTSCEQNPWLPCSNTFRLMWPEDAAGAGHGKTDRYIRYVENLKQQSPYQYNEITGQHILQFEWRTSTALRLIWCLHDIHCLSGRTAKAIQVATVYHSETLTGAATFHEWTEHQYKHAQSMRESLHVQESFRTILCK